MSVAHNDITADLFQFPIHQRMQSNSCAHFVVQSLSYNMSYINSMQIRFLAAESVIIV